MGTKSKGRIHIGSIAVDDCRVSRKTVGRSEDEWTEQELTLGPTINFMRVLWALDHGLQSASKRMEAELGVTGQQRLVVRIIGRYPRISAGDLAAALHLHPSTLTGILRRLVERGVVNRKSHPEDGRRAELLLTKLGEKINKLKAGTVEATAQRVLDGLSRADVLTTQRVLTLLAQELS